MLFSSHQLDQVEELCEQVTIIDHGRLVVSGTVDELATSGARRLRSASRATAPATGRASLPGVTVSEVDGGAVPPGPGRARSIATTSSVPRCKTGQVTQFSFERRRLSEVFREALA